MDLQYLFAQLFNGLVLGAIYIILSIGLTIILGMLGVVNFAHGALCIKTRGGGLHHLSLMVSDWDEMVAKMLGRKKGMAACR